MPPRKLSGRDAPARRSATSTRTAAQQTATTTQASRASVKPGEDPQHPTLGRTSVSEIYRGRHKIALLRDLAMGEWTYAELAKQAGVSEEDIAEFAREHTEEIQEVQAALAGKLAEETAGLWISKKQFRIAELQAQYEDVDSALEQRGRSNWSTAHKDMHRTKLAILRAVAEELGAYPQRTGEPAQTGNAVHYIIETDDADALR